MVGGDYKTVADPTCAAFEAVPCDVFISESTFGLPVFQWPDPEEVAAQVRAWWERNAANGRTSLLCAYALGKSQRLLAGLLDPPGPIAVHGPSTACSAPTVIRGSSSRRAPPWRRRRSAVAASSSRRPPRTAPLDAEAGDVSTAFASGWMTLQGPRRRRGFDQGFTVSDHADWRGLLGAIEATGASQVLVTHGYVDPLVRYSARSAGSRRSDSTAAEEGDGTEESTGSDEARALPRNR